MKSITSFILLFCFIQVAIGQTSAPFITTVYPTNGKIGSTIDISGSGFTGTTTVSFGGILADSFTVVADYDLKVVLNNAASGEVVVTNPEGSDSSGGFVFIDSACTIYTSPAIAHVSACSKAFPYKWSGQIYPGPGTYTFHSSDIYGCDSVITLQLTASGPCTWSEVSGTDSLQANSTIFSIITDTLKNVYTAGTFKNSSGKCYVAKWDGTSWSELGGTNSLGANSTIKSLCADQNWNIYAAGSFRDSTGHSYVAKWNGNNWSEVGGPGGIGSKAFSSIRSICSDKTGNIYVAGWFTNDSGKYYIAKWNGASWSELGGLNSLAANSFPWSVCSDKFGNIYTGGLFTNGSGNIYVAKWDGTKWSELGGANSLAADIVNNSPHVSQTQVGYISTDTAGNVYVAGDFANSSGYHYIAKWDGTKWSEVGGNNSLKANSLEQVVKVDSYGNVYAAGFFSNSNGNQYVAKWDGKQWSEVGGLSGLSASDDIIDLCVDKWGSVYTGGAFMNANGYEYVAKYTLYISVKDGNWNDPTTWLIGQVPPDNANVIIKNTIIVTANAICSSLNEETGGHVIVDPGVNFHVGN